MRRLPFLLAVAAVACSTCASSSGSRRALQRGADAPIAVETPKSAGAGFDLVHLRVSPLPAAPAGAAVPQTDGTRLFARQTRNGQMVRLLRLDPRSGAEIASYQVRPIPAGSHDGSISYTITDAGIVVLDGDRKVVRILDPDSLRVRHTVPMPANARTDVGGDGVVHGPFWVGHRRYDYDELAGKETLMGATRVVPPSNAPTTRTVPPCGTANGVQPNARTLVVNVECAYQIAVIDLPTGRVRTFPSLLGRVDIALLGRTVWARWKDLGYVGRIDWRRMRMTLLDLNADGPLLAKVFGLHLDDGSVWVTGIPADTRLPRVNYRIDPGTVRVTARIWSDVIAIVHGVGYAVGSGGRLGTFDPRGISGGAPTPVVRPSTAPPKQYRPRNATERAVARAFSQAFDYHLPNDRAARYLPHDPHVFALRTKLVNLAKHVYKNVHIVVTDIAIDGVRASVSYAFTLGATSAFFPLSAQLVRTTRGWAVTTDSLCYLASAAAVEQC